MNLRRCQTLTDAIPRLEKIFAEKANPKTANAFPLFNKSTHQAVWKSVPINKERQAAVLVPLVSFQGEPSILFTTRSMNLPHPGEVSFPGGHLEEGVDNSLTDTALREAQEELLGDYPWDEVHILGQSTALPSAGGTPVTPIIGVLPYEIHANTFPGNPQEVDEVFVLSLKELLEIESRERLQRFKSNVPVFHRQHGERIWGLTAVITRPILHNLFKPVLLESSRL
ncbi:unnamed protein product [Cylindrotheca closterium]|uniref:Nudix hydrolase domain-containing protein n=1 Tax=Cylindrotheca closterium TaxID=2856 RepID=A0AAD2CBW3_9STRA|nr:unnamed protein product [Cylindrotheca closterium]